MHRKFELLSVPEESEQPQYGATHFFLSPLCAVISCFHTVDCGDYSITTNGYAMFNVRIHLGACRIHEVGARERGGGGGGGGGVGGGGGQAQINLHKR